MTRPTRSLDDLAQENDALRARLQEAEDILGAIRAGGVDALIAEGPHGEQVFTLEGADHSYRTFVETMNEGAATVAADGMIVYCNRVFADMVGCPLEQTLGANLRQFIAASDREKLESLLVQNEGGSHRIELSLTDAHANGIPVQVSGCSMSFKTETVLCLVVTDLRGHKRQEALLVESQSRLRALATELNLTEQRERKRLATDLHDHLAQLLVLAKMKLSQARRVPGLAPVSEELITQAQDVLSRSLSYTRTLVSDLSPPVLPDFGLPTALRWLGERMRHHQLTVNVEMTDDDHLLLPEDRAVLLFQSVRELLINAAKHAEAGQAHLSLEQRDGALRIQVRDSGKGFDIGQTAAAAAADDVPSAKFGLFSIRERMRALGGTFDIDSAPGQGTTATLVLPLRIPSGGIDDQSRHAEVAANLVDSIPNLVDQEPVDHALIPPADLKSPIRVLLVDDHAVVRQGLRSVLESYVEVQIVGEAANGEEAVTMVERLEPAVVVMDINMPKMNGIEATVKIKARHPHVVVIGLSVQANSTTRDAMTHAGASLLLTKEAAVDELYEAIRNATKRGDSQSISTSA
ncbi:MAG TPA: response regulator [Nitrospira sp.]